MVHGHGHHTHEDVEALEERLVVRDGGGDGDGPVIVYKTLDPDFFGDIGGYLTGDSYNDNGGGGGGNDDQPKTQGPTNVGVGPAVGVTHTASATEDKPTEEPKTTEVEQTEHHQPQTTEKPKVQSEPTETKQDTQPTETKITPSEVTATNAHEAITADSHETQNAATRASFVTSATPTADTTHDANSLAATGATSADSSSASSTALSTHQEGLSSGAKAGIAIGVILGVGLVAGLIFFFIRKKKRSQPVDETFNEKGTASQNLPPPPISKHVPPSAAPQLENVRPVTQFMMPGLSNPTFDAPAAAGGAATGAAVGSAAVASRNLTGGSSPPMPPNSAGSGSNPFNDPVNPFGGDVNPSNEHSPVSASNVGVAVAGGAAGAAALASHGSQKSGKSERSRPTSAESTTLPPGHPSPSPVSADGDSAAPAGLVEDGAMAAGAAMGAATNAPPPAPLNVHRVQMDFNPSMDDELELRIGTLVRLLHEYDDGWTLCARLDRSQQGVAPRSCLSAHPVKPRQRPPGPGPRGPPMTPPMGRNGRISSGPPPGRFYPQDARPRSPAGPPRYPPGRSMSPAGGFPVPRSMSPGPRAMSPGPRSMSPGPRSMSPGPGARPGPPQSMSPGPHGPPGMQPPMMPAAQRQRSNSGGNISPPNVAAAPPVSSPLAASPPPAPAPTSQLPAIPNAESSPPPVSTVTRKPVGSSP